MTRLPPFSPSSVYGEGLSGGFSPRRVGAMMLRYWYLLRSSWPRLLDLVYWPTVQMLTWGLDRKSVV